MRERPREFRILAAILILAAASFPIQVMMAYGYTPLELDAALAGLSPLNWFVIFASVIHAYLIYEAAPSVLISTPIFLLLVGWNNYVVARTGLNSSTWAAFFATAAAFLIHLPMFRKDTRRVLFNPKLRWWRTSRRKRASMRAIIRPVMGGELQSCTFDVSASGAFIRMDSANWLPLKNVNFYKLQQSNLKVGSRCSVRLLIDHMRVIQCGAEIVRHSPANGEHPEGFAVRFVSLDESQKKMLNDYIHGSERNALVQTVA